MALAAILDIAEYQAIVDQELAAILDIAEYQAIVDQELAVIQDIAELVVFLAILVFQGLAVFLDLAE